MKTEILKKIRTADDYISGQVICDELGVSRTAVWKYIKQYKEEGYEFDAVPNKGYKIIKYPDILTASELESQLDFTDGIIKKVVYFDETGSTNSEAKKYADSDDSHECTLFITECQTAGRGRRGRNWVSPAGSGIWMTLLLYPDIQPKSASMLTIVAAMAMTNAINDVLGEDGHCYIKWPNDIVINKKKVCGILTEMSAEPDYINYVVTGIGLNVNTTDFDDEIKDKASSLYKETGKHIKRSDVVVAFSLEFNKYYKKFLETGDLSSIRDEYNKMLINAGKQVIISGKNDNFTGIAKYINEKGELVVEKDDKTIVNVISGEVSVRGLYGYV